MEYNYNMEFLPRTQDENIMQRKESGIDCLHTIRRMYFSTTYNVCSKYGEHEMVFA